jgi:sialate O-acetylesterase
LVIGHWSLRAALGAFALVLSLSFATVANADVTLAPLFRDGAVLQREKPLPVWGTADAGESITVTFAGQSASATAGADGRWSVTFKPLTASAEPRDLAVSGRNKLVVHDVVVGEVWLASGQSNMAYALGGATDGKADIKAANFPLLRQFKVAQQPSFDPLANVDGAWAPALPPTAGQFTAVGYYFGLYLHQKLNVPVGIINSSWGGTAVEAWIAPDAYRANPAIGKTFAQQEKTVRAKPEEKTSYETALATWEKARADAKAAKQAFSTPAPKAPAGLPGPRTAAGLYNGMINPLVPCALRGAIWYQGEANADHAAQYPPLFAALITGWRKQFAQGDFPFYWVQLPNLERKDRDPAHPSWAALREVQTQTLALPNTGQAVTIDVGEAKNLHPKNKKTVGQRLALLALARTYRVEHVIDSGPVFKSAKREGSAYRIAYEPVAGAAEPSSGTLKASPAGLTGFELAGPDKVFHPAEAKIDGPTVVVSCAEVADPAAVRYAYANAPVAGLFNAEGLPAAPFRTDTW